jgi:hypothetical protein
MVNRLDITALLFTPDVFALGSAYSNMRVRMLKD